MLGILPRPKPPVYPTPPQIIEFYHGTTLDNAKKLMGDEIGVYSVPLARIQDDSEYTDFGKGFYIHPPENRKLAIDWAKSAASKWGTDWGVLCLRLTADEFSGIEGEKLLFKNKVRDRPHNAPVLTKAREQRREIERTVAPFIPPWLVPPLIVEEAIISQFDQRCNWLEFVEFNRHVNQSIQRPKDNDWTHDYSIMRGPIWVQRDSGLPGKLPPFDESIHQINLGVKGLEVINRQAIKSRRYVIDKTNENAPPP